ncbi:hypothetical protein K492DRAFT_187062 [Lichtheimia hyalospora FSU 10163]|nr:hypothetical protein K492DRAFT_187062 [Lichtheimia hyalospora FSU 10163]
MHSCVSCTVTFDTYRELDEHRRTMHQDTVLLRFISQGGWTTKVKRQRDTCFHCPCGVFRHRDSKETRRHAKNCKLASMPETRVAKNVRRPRRSSRTSIGSPQNQSSDKHNEQQEDHPNARMEALANAAGTVVRTSQVMHPMVTRRRANTTRASMIHAATPDLFHQVTSLVAADTGSSIRLLHPGSNDDITHHRALELSQPGSLRFSFDVLHARHTNRRLVSIHIALHSSMIDVLAMARIITRVCDSVPGGAPAAIRIWRSSST